MIDGVGNLSVFGVGGGTNCELLVAWGLEVIEGIAGNRMENRSVNIQRTAPRSTMARPTLAELNAILLIFLIFLLRSIYPIISEREAGWCRLV